MIKRIIALVAFTALLLVPSVYAQEVIESFSESNISVLNNELRRDRQGLRDLSETVATKISEIVSIPAGVIVMWSGAITAIPSGWVICDGSNGTPNLTDRFVLHADADSGGTNDVGDTGETTVTGSHVLTEAELAAHRHNNEYTNRVGTHEEVVASMRYPTESSSLVSDRWTTADSNEYRTTSVGSDSGHTHSTSGQKPKYYALAYIMKL